MENRKLTTILIIIIFLFNLIPSSTSDDSNLIKTRDSNIIKNDPIQLQLEEDSKPYYLDFNDIFINFTQITSVSIWNNSAWTSIFENKNLTISIKRNDTVEFILKQDMHGTDKILLNATNSDNKWMNQEILVTIIPINDPPEINIIQPKNGTTLIEDEVVIFKSESYDPDMPFYDNLSYVWISNIDGILGYNKEIEIKNLTCGWHIISLRVTDSKGLFDENNITIFVKSDFYSRPYEVRIFRVPVEIEDRALLIKQNETKSCNFEVINHGYLRHNVTIEIINNYDFIGLVEPSYDIITLEPYESRILEVKVFVPKEAKIGFYPFDIVVKSLMIKDKREYEFYGKHSESFDVIVISNDTSIGYKQANKPVWEIGNKWEYKIRKYNNLEGNLTVEIIEETKIDLNNKEKAPSYILSLKSNLTPMEKKIPNSSRFIVKSLDYECKNYYKEFDFTLIKQETILKYEMENFLWTETDEYKTTKNYNPPINEYDFPIKPGEKWFIRTSSEENYENITDLYGPESSYGTYNEEIFFVCLGTEWITTPAGTFETFLIMRVFDVHIVYLNSYNDIYDNTSTRSKIFDMNKRFCSIDYYSPQVGFTVKQVNYDYDLNLDTIIELMSYSIKKDFDLDFDNMPDYWEEKYNIDSPDSDDDNDTFTNLEEYIKGTNPINYKDNPNNPIDSDQDGIPDTWEHDFGFDPNDPDDAEKDADKDGFSNLIEYNSATSPRDSNDHPFEKNRKKDESLFGLGKISNIDLAFIYLLITSVIILILITLAFVINRNKKGIAQKKIDYPEQRVIDEGPITKNNKQKPPPSST